MRYPILGLCCLFILLVSGLSTYADENETVVFQWSKQADTAWVYKQSRSGNPQLDFTNNNAIWFSTDITNARKAVASIPGYTGVSLAFILQVLDGKKRRVGDTWTLTLPSAQKTGNRDLKWHFDSIREEDGRQLARIVFAPDEDENRKSKIKITIDFDTRNRCLYFLENRQKWVVQRPDPKNLKKIISTTSEYVFTMRYKWKINMRGPTLTKLIDETIEECIEDLKELQTRDGYIGDSMYKGNYGLGSCCLSVLALLKAGVPADDRVIQKAMVWIRKNANLKQTYSVGLLCMTLEALYTPKDEIENSEGHSEKNSLEQKPRKLSPRDKKLMKKAVNWIVKSQSKTGAWSYTQVPRAITGGKNSIGYDNSNSQYALLGLYAAARCDIYTHPGHYKNILEHWLGDQAETGDDFVRASSTTDDEEASVVASKLRGWSYNKALSKRMPSMTASASMTCAGVASVAIAYACLQKTRKSTAKKYRMKAYHSIDDGLAWLEKNYSVQSGNGIAGAHSYYYLYGLERACVLTGTRSLDHHDWYREGAVTLCSQVELNANNPFQQYAISRWGNASDTSFVLLFLKQATAPLPPVSGEDE